MDKKLATANTERDSAKDQVKNLKEKLSNLQANLSKSEEREKSQQELLDKQTNLNNGFQTDLQEKQEEVGSLKSQLEQSKNKVAYLQSRVETNEESNQEALDRLHEQIAECQKDTSEALNKQQAAETEALTSSR